MNRFADWLDQAHSDLDLAAVSAAAGHHEWACFACHQAVEKALKALHLHHGQQDWGHGLGRSWVRFTFPPPLAPRAFPVDPRVITSAGFKAMTPSAMPVRSLTQSRLRCPELGLILHQVARWPGGLRPLNLQQ